MYRINNLNRLLISLIIVVFVTACNQDQGTEQNTENSENSETSMEQSTYEAFGSFTKKAVDNPNYRVSYEIENPKGSNAIIKQWFKGNKSRIDTEMEGTKARIYQLGEETTTCMNQEGNWSCFKLPETQTIPNVGIQGRERLEDIENNLESYRNRITKIDNREIAGEETSCFRVNEAETSNYWVSCYSNNHAIPLYMKGENSEGTWKMTATDFQPSVSDDDFNLPAKAESMPNMPGDF